MSKSKTSSAYLHGCGCGCGGGCGSGLGSSEHDKKNEEANGTKTDLIETAKNYINDEIPFRYKAAAVAVGLGYCWWRSRRRR